MAKKSARIQPRKYGVIKKLEKLSVSQRLFAEALIADPNMSPSQAAIKAGYSAKTAAVKGSQLMKNPVIAQMIGRAIQDRIDRVKIEQDDIIRFLYNALTLDPLDLFNESPDGSLSLKELQKIPKEIRILITKLEAKSRPIGDSGEVETRVKFEWVSKELVLQLCMKHLGMTGEDKGKDVNVNVQVINQNNLIQQLREAVVSKSKVIDANSITTLAQES
jgi:phage terminase small subunit